MYCCTDCFLDHFLKKHIIVNGIEKQTCSFCGRTDRSVIEAADLLDLFLPFMELYVTQKSGIPLYILIQEDWSIFAGNNIHIWKKIIIAVLGESYNGRSAYGPRKIPDHKKIAQWSEFREELKHKNRFFPEKGPDIEHLKRLFGFLKLHEPFSDNALFRARINTEGKRFDCSDMGVPPSNLASNGRANPVGIPYLYVASDIETAISEVRPSKGDVVTVAEYKGKKGLDLVDLRNPKLTISPFELNDDDFFRLYIDMPYLTLLGEELSKPVLPREAGLEYLPSQYLCEFVKHIGFDGIIYSSSLSDGYNIAIFDDDMLECIMTENYKIINTEVESEKI